MSETVLFSIGSVVFAMTVWGTVMAGGFWFRQLQEADGQPAAADDADRPPASS